MASIRTERAGPRTTGVRTLAVLVATCACVLWAIRDIRDRLDPTTHNLKVLRRGDRFERRAAAGELGAVPAEDVPRASRGLIGALEDEDPEVREVAARSLGAVFRPRSAAPAAGSDDLVLAAAALREGLHDRAPAVRTSAAGSLGALAVLPYPPTPPPREALLALTEALGDADDGVREVAASALGAYGPWAESVPPALRDALGDPSPLVRTAAARALGSFTRDLGTGFLALLKILDSGDAALRMIASQELNTHYPKPPSAASPDLIRLVRSEHPEARSAASWALGRIGPAAEPAIPDLLRLWTENPFLKSRLLNDLGMSAAEALGKIAPGTPRAREVVATLAEALDDRSIRPLGESMDDPALRRRYAAARALLRFGPEAQALRPAIRAVLAEAADRRDVYFRSEAASLLAALDAAEAGPSTATAPRPRGNRSADAGPRPD